MAAKSSPRKRWRRYVWFTLLVLCLGMCAAFTYRFYHHRDLRYCTLGELYLEHGDTNDALQQFREALKLNPKLMEARVGLIRTLVLRKEFSPALEELDTATGNGLSESEAALLKARVFAARAGHRRETAGKVLTVKICEEAVAEDLDPAIALVQSQAESAGKPAAAYALLGDLCRQELGFEKSEEALLVRAYKQARDMDKKDEMAAREKDSAALVLKMRSVKDRANRAYQDAIQKDPTAVEPRMAIAQEMLQAYYPRTDEAKAILEPLMKLPAPPGNAVHQMAVAEWYAGDLDHAAERLKPLVNAPNPQFDDLVTDAEILIERERWPEARAVADKLEKIGPKRLEFHWIMGQVLLHEGEADKALDQLQNIFSNPRTWAEARLALARALMSAKPPKREQAVSQFSKVLDDCKSATPSNVRAEKQLNEAAYQACMALAGAARELGPNAAQDYAMRALGIAPERAEAFQIARDLCKEAGAGPEKLESLALLHAGGMARDPAQRDAADEFLRKEYEEFKDTPAKGASIRLLRANLLASRGSYLEAAAIYDELRKEFPKATIVADVQAQLDVQLGHDKEAREVYESVLSAHPSDMRAVSGLVRVLVHMAMQSEGAEADKYMDEAHATLRRAAGASNSEQVWATMLDIFLRGKRKDEAVSFAKYYVEKNPLSPPAQCMLAEVLWEQGDLKGAKSAFDAALKLAPDFLPAYRRPLLDMEEGRAADAVTLLRVAADKLQTASAKADLAVALQADGNVKEAGDILKGLSAGAQGAALQLDTPRWYLAVLLAGEGYLQNADAMSDLMAAREFLGLPADRLQLLQRIAAAPKPRTLAAKVNAVLWLSMNVCPGVLEQAELLVKELPDEPMTACWRARLLDADGKHEEAVRACQDVLAAHPNFVMARLLLAQCQQRSGKPGEAVQSLDAAINEVPPELIGGIQLQRANLLAASGRLDEAIAGYLAIASPPKVAAVACNEAAWLYATKRNDPDSALPIAKQAVQLSPNDPAVLDTLGWVYYLKGENDQALEILRKAKVGLPGNPTLRYHLGLALLKIGRKADAKVELEEALAISRDFPEAADAAARLAGI